MATDIELPSRDYEVTISMEDETDPPIDHPIFNNTELPDDEPMPDYPKVAGHRRTKYIAYKLSNLNTWLWFKYENVRKDEGAITALDGWGQGGAYVDITFEESTIVGIIFSDSLMYT